MGAAQDPAQGPGKGREQDGGPDLVCRGRAQSGEWCWWGWHLTQTAGPGMPLAMSLPLPGSLPPSRKSLLLIPVPGAEASLQWRTASATGEAWFHRCGPKWFSNSSLHMFLGAPLLCPRSVCSRRLTWSNYHLLQGKKRRLQGRHVTRSHVMGKTIKDQSPQLPLTFPLLIAAFCVQGPGDVKFPLKGSRAQPCVQILVLPRLASLCASVLGFKIGGNVDSF